MNPLQYLLPALFQAITQGLSNPEGGGYVAAGHLQPGYVDGAATPLLLAGSPVPVYQHLPTTPVGNRYILLTQPTCNRTGGAQNCRNWDVTVLLDCVTLFTPGHASSLPADALAGLLAERLDGVVLSLGEGLQASRGEIDQILAVNDAFDGEQTDVHRYLRYRAEITQHTLTPSM